MEVEAQLAGALPLRQVKSPRSGRLYGVTSSASLPFPRQDCQQHRRAQLFFPVPARPVSLRSCLASWEFAFVAADLIAMEAVNDRLFAFTE